MATTRDTIDHMRIASPCPTSWDRMTGNGRSRFCDLCGLNVYNISEMTTQEVKKLLAGTEGRICARLYKRSDGTVLTKDCPVGIRAIRRRVSRVAGACATAIFSFCFSVIGQRGTHEEDSCPSNAKITIERLIGQRSILRGVIKDSNGAVLAGATVTLVSSNTKRIIKTDSNEEGLFQFSTVELGLYKLRFEASGFQSTDLKAIIVEANQLVNVDLQMDVDGESALVGIVGESPLIDSNSSTLKSVFNTNQITKLPF